MEPKKTVVDKIIQALAMIVPIGFLLFLFFCAIYLAWMLISIFISEPQLLLGLFLSSVLFMVIGYVLVKIVSYFFKKLN